jgi:membrane fusion protein, multidrug efflux system
VRATSAAYGRRAFEGKVSVIDPRVDPVTRTVRLTAEFPNADEALKPGMFLSVALTVSARDAVVVPEEAVVGEGLRHLVYVVKDNVAERRVVRIGQRQEARVEIVEGLQPGETIVIRGVQRVRPGAPVTPKPVAEAAPITVSTPAAPGAAAQPPAEGQAPVGGPSSAAGPQSPAAAASPSPGPKPRTSQPAARGAATTDRRS